MFYILKIKNIFNSKLLFMLTLLLPFTSQAIISFHIQLHTHSYYFFTEDIYTKNVQLNDAIFKLREITSESNSYCAKCGRLARDTCLIHGTNRRNCYPCFFKRSPKETNKLEVDWSFREHLVDIYKILNDYAYTKNPLMTSVALYRSNHETAKAIDISAIGPDTIPNIIKLNAIKCDQGTHPVQSVMSSAARFEALNTFDNSQQKIHQCFKENHKNQEIEKLIFLKNNKYAAITKPDQKSQSYIYLYTLNQQLNIEDERIHPTPIDATHILAFEFDKQQEVFICSVLFESKIVFSQMHLNTTHEHLNTTYEHLNTTHEYLNGTDECLNPAGEHLNPIYEFFKAKTQRSTIDIPTVKVFVVGETYYFIIKDQKQLSLIEISRGTITILPTISSHSICPSIGYNTDHALYIYYLERSPETQDQIHIKKMIVDPKEIKICTFRYVAVPEKEMECALSLAPSNLALAFSIQTHLNTETYIISLNDDSQTEDVSYKFTPDFKPQIDWHPTQLMFAQHTASKRFTVISLRQQQNERGTGVFLGNRLEYSTQLESLNQIFLLNDSASETKVCGYARGSINDKNDYLFRLFKRE